MHRTIVRLALLSALCSAAGILRAAPGRGTADALKAEAPALEGKVVTANVACFSGRDTADSDVVIEGFTCVWAYTASQGEGGGYIEVALPTERLSWFMRQYGSDLDFKPSAKIKTRPLKGTMTRGLSKAGDPVWYIKVPKSSK